MNDWFDVERGRSAWREVGHGPPLVFLHGLGGSRESWNPQLQWFGSTRRCLAWDMPGYGDSPAPATALTYELIVDRFAEFLDEVEVEQTDVVGLSFGGMHALHVALHHPDRLSRLVLADTSPAFGMDGTQADAWIAARLAPLTGGGAAGRSVGLAGNVTLEDLAPQVLDSIVAKPLDAGIRQDLIAGFARIGESGFRAAVQCLPHNDIRAGLYQIAHPSLVLVGEFDEETPPSYARVLAEGLPNSRLIVLGGVGHLTPSEDPNLFNRHVQRFLDQGGTLL